MLFANGQFLIFLPIFIIIYYVIPSRLQKYVLLGGSLFFAYCQSLWTLIAVIVFAFISYIYSCIYDKVLRYKNVYIIATVIILVAIMITSRILNIALLGISFYTLRVIGYVVDVHKEQKVDNSLFDNFLFVSYFPLLTAGPIEKSGRLFAEFAFPKSFNEKRAYKGFIYLIIGYFMKYVIADRSAVIVDAVYSEYSGLAGSICLIAVLMYSIQIYSDFGGYSYIAIGISEILGISICENFRRPYLSENFKDFWQRWHISLSTWLRDYIYIPLGGNRKGFVRKEINILLTFLVSGIWHGQGVHFVVWGIIHGTYRVIEDIKNKLYKYGDSNSRAIQIVRTVITFLLISFAWIFFRASDTKQALGIIGHMLTDFRPSCLINGDVFLLGWGRLQVCGIILACIVLFVFEILVEKNNLSFEHFSSLSSSKRNIICYIFLTWIVISLVQIYGMGQETGFIYANF